MRKLTAILTVAMGLMAAAPVMASAAPVLEGGSVSRARHSDIVQASYWYHHRHWEHRRWEHDHWHYW